MTVINTNVGALTARTYALNANDGMQTAMERLSSGLRINSAADDAAGLAVANKMESQLRGINVAIRNSQDGISLVQTAEAGMSEITNMIIRMRELSVQMNNGVYTDGDRSNAQLEVSALLKEINKIADNTAFNNVKVLDGTYDTTIRAGNTNIETIDLTISSQKNTALGGVAAETALAESTAAGTRATASGETSTVSAKAATAVKVGYSDAMKTFISGAAGKTISYALAGTDGGTFTNDAANQLIDGGTIAANGTKTVDLTVTARKASDNAVETASNNTLGVLVASAFTVEESDTVSIAQSTGTAALIAGNINYNAEYVLTDASNSYEMDTAIAGTIKNKAANPVNYSGTPITLTVDVFDRKATETATISGETLGGAAKVTTGAINATFEEADTVTLATSNKMKALLTDSDVYGGAPADAANLAFAVTTAGADASGTWTVNDDTTGVITGTGVNYLGSGGYTIQVKSTLKETVADNWASTAKAIAVSNIADSVETSTADLYRAGSMTIGVDAAVDTTSAVGYAGATFEIGAGTTAELLAAGVLTFSSDPAKKGHIIVDESALADGDLAAGSYTIERIVRHDGNNDGASNTHKETITLTVIDFSHTDTYTVTSTSSSKVATDNITLSFTKSDEFKETINLSVTSDNDYLSDVDVSTKAGAARAVTILDKALDEISSSQAKLGAIQNRLQHNIDNLSTGSMLTETARGRIMDADFARETSELSKQQILGQAATSMLAQANQSKQSILALLQ